MLGKKRWFCRLPRYYLKKALELEMEYIPYDVVEQSSNVWNDVGE
jgi:hypothetical protein